MRKLDRLLSTIDKPTRTKELIAYAKSVGIDPTQARDQDNEYNEEKLSILIYDAELKNLKKANRGFKQMAIFVAFAALLLLLTTKLPKMVSHFFIKAGEDEIEYRPKKAVIVYDKNGNPMTTESEPTYVEVMHGVYKDYDENGNVKKVYYYKDGELKKTEKAETNKVNIEGKPLHLK